MGLDLLVSLLLSLLFLYQMHQCTSKQAAKGIMIYVANHLLRLNRGTLDVSAKPVLIRDLDEE